MSQTSDQSVVQHTLTGEPTDETRKKPTTMLWCPETEQYVLRSQRFEWPHELQEIDSSSSGGGFGGGGGGGGDGDDEEEDEAERVGGLYEITLSYTVDYRFKIPAYSEHQAEDRAKDLVEYPGNCASMDKVHTRREERSVVWADDPKLPDDYDPYAGTALWEVYGDGE